MGATNSIRWAILEQVIRLVGRKIGGVQVAPGWPGDEAEADMVWAGEIDGEVSISLMSTGRKYRDDLFTIDWHFRSIGTDLGAATTKIDEMVGAFEDVFADDPTLGDFAGLLVAEFSQGPSDRSEVKSTGWVVFAMGTASFHARYE